MEPLYSHQINALKKMHNGCILCGGVGSGKSRTALAYYYVQNGGDISENSHWKMKPLDNPRKLYIITTAKKRDSLEWQQECLLFYLDDVVVDSWNNIKKYSKLTGAFVIFDEQRVVGRGAWVKAFLNIARKNKWILLSATPGDTWSDYIPVFIANGFYRNKTDFYNQHCVFSPYVTYPRIEKYVNTGILSQHASDILVRMKYKKDAEQHHIYVQTNYDKNLYKVVYRDRWDPYENAPIDETGKWCYLLRKVCNSDMSRISAVARILEEKPRVIIFYNFTYELEMLRMLFDSLGIDYSEWNGEKHEEVLEGDSWGYFVQYSAGAEGWNCITTDTIIFYSQNYSYRITVQAAGRIDRMNTPFSDLYYYHLKSVAPIDVAIARALKEKKNFNERRFIGN